MPRSFAEDTVDPGFGISIIFIVPLLICAVAAKLSGKAPEQINTEPVGPAESLQSPELSAKPELRLVLCYGWGGTYIPPQLTLIESLPAEIVEEDVLP